MYHTIILMLELGKYINSDVYIGNHADSYIIGEYNDEEVDYLTAKYQHDSLVYMTARRLCPSVIY